MLKHFQSIFLIDKNDFIYWKSAVRFCIKISGLLISRFLSNSGIEVNGIMTPFGSFESYALKGFV